MLETLQAKAFVRKFPANSGKTGRPITIVLMLIDGDAGYLQDESIHAVGLSQIGEGMCALNIAAAVSTGDKFDGLRADQVICEL